MEFQKRAVTSDVESNKNQAGRLRPNNVVSTSMRRVDVDVDVVWTPFDCW